MLSQWLKLFLVSTAVAPVFFTLAFLEFRRDALWTGVLYVSIGVLLTSGCLKLLDVAKRKLEVLDIKIESAATADREVIGFLLAYVMPLLLSGTAPATLDGITVMFLIALFAVVVWGTHSYDFNPVLGIFRYHFYEVETPGGISYVLITRKRIVSVQQITKIVQLTEYVILDTT